MEAPRRIAHPELEPPLKEPTESGRSLLEHVQERFRWRTNLVIGIVLVLIVVGSWLFQVQEELNRRKVIPFGVAAPWPEQLGIAQQEASRIDATSTLASVEAGQINIAKIIPGYAGPAQPEWDKSGYAMLPVTTTLSVRFTFRTRSEPPVIVTIEDSQPPAVAEIDRGVQYGGLILLDTLKQYQELISISPRAALEATFRELETLTDWTQAEGVSSLGGPVIRLVYREDIWGVLDEPAEMPGDQPVLWRVSHRRPTEEIRRAYFWVDPTTGEVLDTELEYMSQDTRVPATTTPAIP